MQKPVAKGYRTIMGPGSTFELCLIEMDTIIMKRSQYLTQYDTIFYLPWF